MSLTANYESYESLIDLLKALGLDVEVDYITEESSLPLRLLFIAAPRLVTELGRDLELFVIVEGPNVYIDICSSDDSWRSAYLILTTVDNSTVCLSSLSLSSSLFLDVIAAWLSYSLCYLRRKIPLYLCRKVPIRVAVLDHALGDLRLSLPALRFLSSLVEEIPVEDLAAVKTARILAETAEQVGIRLVPSKILVLRRHGGYLVHLPISYWKEHRETIFDKLLKPLPPPLCLWTVNNRLVIAPRPVEDSKIFLAMNIELLNLLTGREDDVAKDIYLVKSRLRHRELLKRLVKRLTEKRYSDLDSFLTEVIDIMWSFSRLYCKDVEVIDEVGDSVFGRALVKLREELEK